MKIALRNNSLSASQKMGSYSTLAAAFLSAGAQCFAADVANNGNGSDMRVLFDNALNEATVNEYRLMVVDSADAASFDLAAANAVAIPRYTERIPFGGVQKVVITAATETVAGELIANDKPYQVFVLSVADGALAQNNQLSAPSNPITLRTVSGIGAALLPGSLSASLYQGILKVSVDGYQDQAGTIELYQLDGSRMGSWAFDGQHLEVSGIQTQTGGTYLLQWLPKSGSSLQMKLNAR